MKRTVLLSLAVSLAITGVISDIMTLLLGYSVELWMKYTAALVFTIVSTVDYMRNQGE